MDVSSSRMWPSWVMLGLGSGISSMISTLVSLALYEAAVLVHMQRLRSKGCQLARCHGSTMVLKRPSDLKLCMRLSPAASYSTSGTSVEIILDIPGPNPNIKQAPAVTDALQVRAR